MEDIKQKTLVLRRDGQRFADELRNGPTKNLDYDWAIKQHSAKYLSAIKEACMKHRNDRRISGYVEVDGWGDCKFSEKLPCVDPQEIKKSEQKDFDTNGFRVYKYPLFKNEYPYQGFALPIQDSTFANKFCNHLEKELYDEGFSYVSVKPVTLDRIKITKEYKPGLFQRKSEPVIESSEFKKPLNFYAKKEGKFTTMQVMLRW